MDGYRDPTAVDQALHHQSAGRVELGDDGDHILQVRCSCSCMQSQMVSRQDHVLRMRLLLLLHAGAPVQTRTTPCW